MSEAVVCASCPPEHQAMVSQACRASQIVKAFSGSGPGTGPQWESQVLMATVGLVEDRNAQSASIFCLEGGGTPKHSQERLVQAIRAALGNANFPVYVENMSIGDFWTKFGRATPGSSQGTMAEHYAASPPGVMSARGGPWPDGNGAQGAAYGQGNALDGNSSGGKGYGQHNQQQTFTPRNSGNGNQQQMMTPRSSGNGSPQNQQQMFTPRGQRRISSVADPLQQKTKRNSTASAQSPSDDLLVVWLCGECSAYFETYELLADHQQSEYHQQPDLSDCGRRFVSSEELASLNVVGASKKVEAERQEAANGCSPCSPATQVFDIVEDKFPPNLPFMRQMSPDSSCAEDNDHIAVQLEVPILKDSNGALPVGAVSIGAAQLEVPMSSADSWWQQPEDGSPEKASPPPMVKLDVPRTPERLGVPKLSLPRSGPITPERLGVPKLALPGGGSPVPRLAPPGGQQVFASAAERFGDAPPNCGSPTPRKSARNKKTPDFKTPSQDIQQALPVGPLASPYKAGGQAKEVPPLLSACNKGAQQKGGCVGRSNAGGQTNEKGAGKHSARGGKGGFADQQNHHGGKGDKGAYSEQQLPNPGTGGSKGGNRPQMFANPPAHGGSPQNMFQPDNSGGDYQAHQSFNNGAANGAGQQNMFQPSDGGGTYGGNYPAQHSFNHGQSNGGGPRNAFHPESGGGNYPAQKSFNSGNGTGGTPQNMFQPGGGGAGGNYSAQQPFHGGVANSCSPQQNMFQPDVGRGNHPAPQTFEDVTGTANHGSAQNMFQPGGGNYPARGGGGNYPVQQSFNPGANGGGQQDMFQPGNAGGNYPQHADAGSYPAQQSFNTGSPQQNMFYPGGGQNGYQVQQSMNAGGTGGEGGGMCYQVQQPMNGGCGMSNNLQNMGQQPMSARGGGADRWANLR